MPFNLVPIFLATLAWVGTTVGAGWWAYGAGKDSEIASQDRENAAIQAATDKMAKTAAEAISKIQFRNTTIKQEVQHEITERVVYRDCVHTDEQLRRINAAIAGTGSYTAASSSLPAASAPR